jgi:predicted dehydrogenase
MTIDALRSGLHVLCEKPMALNAEEGRAMLAAAHESGKILSIAFHYRHKAAARAAKRIVESGELGDIYMVRVTALRRRGIPSWGGAHLPTRPSRAAERWWISASTCSTWRSGWWAIPRCKR